MHCTMYICAFALFVDHWVAVYCGRLALLSLVAAADTYCPLIGPQYSFVSGVHTTIVEGQGGPYPENIQTHKTVKEYFNTITLIALQAKHSRTKEGVEVGSDTISTHH